MQCFSIQALQTHIWPDGREHRDVWMIADGARNRRIFETLVNSHLNHSCLYSGYLVPELEIAAPYLVQIEYGDREARQLIEQAWGNSWGVFLRCEGSLRELRRHLRRLLVVQDWRGRRLAFRYYDPRVLRVYLPTCTREELETVFGPVECFWMEAASQDALLQFRRSPQGLVRDSLSVIAGKARSQSETDR